MVVQPKLTPDQLAVVESRSARSLVIAPAGSGKTEVLIRRIEHLLDESPGDSFRLLAVTFTVKAAEELKSRVSRSIGEEAWRVDADTIHGFALDWLQRSGKPVGVGPDVVVYAESRDRLDLLRRFLSSIGSAELDDRTLLSLLERIDSLRTDLVKPQDAPVESLSSTPFGLPDLYEAYVMAMEDAGGIDFPGMLSKLLELFEIDPAVLKRVQRTYKHVLVDEGQDLTHIQAEILRSIVDDQLDLFVVADDRQSINGWAGGGMHWARKLIGSEHEQFELRHNFRCSTRILSLADRVAHHFTPPRHDAVTPPGTPSGEVKGLAVPDTPQEARVVVDWIHELLTRGINPSSLVPGEETRVWPEEVAVLARTRYGLDDVQAELNRRQYRVSIQVDAGSLLASPEARLLHSLLEIQANSNNHPAWRRINDELFNLLGIDAGLYGGRNELNRLVDVVRNSSIQSTVALVCCKPIGPDRLELIMDSIFREEIVDSPDSEKLNDWWIEYQVGSARHDRSLAGFLKYLLRVQQTRPDEPGIRLMTTHRSKGLEFRAVAIVGLAQGSFPHYLALRNERELEEERRAFYVSVTRASRVLLLTWPQRKRTRYGERNDDPSQFLLEAGINL